jgi:GH25 family lysozyme M1 (1,4-beta-N-acetylmuramidase)
MKSYKKYLSIMCALVMAASSLCTAHGATWKRKSNGNYEMIDGSDITGVITRGIDVSRWQNEIDWALVAGDDVTFAMIGTRSRGEVDPQFINNATGAASNGIRIGAYIYSLATNVAEAEAEADFIIDLVKDYPISFPIAYDVEDNATQGSLAKDELTAIIRAFFTKVEAAGYYPILYANEYWLANHLDMDALSDVDVWVARYNTMYTWEDPVMWQATSSGSVDGISTNVDINFLYKDYFTTIPTTLWRLIGGRWYYYQNSIMQKDTWIHDGKNFYYMNESGNPYVGWLEKNGKKYYLDADMSGAMITGWRQFSGVWKYFNVSGDMAIGWVYDGSTWYYMDKNGDMSTGWLSTVDAKYYLNKSGAMATGFNKIDGSYYYFDLSSGAMYTKAWVLNEGTWYYMGTDGAPETGWQKINGVTYYMASDGSMLTGWQLIDGTWYYFNADGGMQTGIIQLDGVMYNLGTDGKMLASTTVMIDGMTYLIDASGAMTQIVAYEATSSEASGSSPSGSSGSTTGSGSSTRLKDGEVRFVGPGGV